MSGATALIGVVVVAIALRLLAIALLPIGMVADAAAYERQAWSVARGLGYVAENGLPTAFYPPLYSYWVALIYAIVGRRPIVVQLLQAGLGAFICWAVYDVIRRVWARTDVALVASVLVALDISGLLYPRLLLTEPLFTAFLAAAVMVWLRAWNDDRLRWWALFGIAIGLAALTRPTVQFLTVLAIAAWPFAPAQGNGWATARHQWRRWLVVGLVVMAGMTATITPWVWRNAVTYGFVTTELTSSTGTGMYISYFPRDGWRFAMVDPSEPLFAEGVHRLVTGGLHGEWERSTYLKGAVAGHLWAHPWLVVKLIPLKLLYLLWPVDWALFNGKGVFEVTYVFALPFVAVGLWQVARDRQWRASAPLWLLLLYTVAITVVFFGSPRYRMPVQPYLYAFAAVGLVAALRGSWHRPWLVAAWATVVGLAGLVIR